MATLDCYAPSNQNAEAYLGKAGINNNYGYGQSFVTPNDGIIYKLNSCRWQLSKALPTGNLNAYAKIYAHTGTYGTSSKPTGDPLATSDAFDISTLPTSFPTTEETMALFSFSGAEQIILTPNTYYVITIEYSGSTASGLNVGIDTSSPTHGGNYSYKDIDDQLWYPNAGVDVIFYVYGNPALTLTQSLNIVSVYSQLGTLIRIFSEVIKAVSLKINQTIKTFAEVIKTAGIVFNQTIRTFTERIIAIPIFATIGTFIKLLIEVVKAIGSGINQTARVFLETLKVGDLLTRVLTALKTLTETIIVVSTNLFDTSRTFVEVLIVAPIYETVLTAIRAFIEIVKTIGNIVKQTDKIFSEVFYVSDPMTIKKIFVETFTEIMKVSDIAIDKILNAIKVLTEQIKIVVNFLFVGVFYKVFSETIKVIDQIFRDIGRVFAEIIIVISNLAQSISRIFVEIVNITSSKLYEISRTFIEVIIIGVVFEKVLETYKVLTEIVNVASSRLTEIARILSERILTIQVFNFLRQRVFIEIIKVAGNFINTTARLFTERIIVGWEKLTLRSFNYIEHLIINGFRGITTMARTFVERILGTTWFEFEKTQFIELIDHFKVGINFVRTISRVFIERIKMASDVIIKYLGRLFEETIIVNPSKFQYELTLLYGRVLSETLNVIGALQNFVIGKLLPEVVKVYDRVAKASAWLMTETIKVVGTMLLTSGKLLTETIIVISNKIVAIGRTFTQIVRMNDITRFRKTQYRILTDHFKATGNAVRGVGRTIKESLIVAGSLGSWAIGKLFIQSLKVFDNFVGVWTLGRTFVETMRVAGNIVGQSVKIFIETIIATSTLLRLLPAKVFSEVIKIYDTIAKSLPKVFIESVTIVGATINQAGKIFVEIVIVASEFVLGTISKLILETIKVAETYLKVWTLGRVFIEIIKITGNGIVEAGRIFIEVINVSGTFILGTISKLLIETVKIYEITSYVITRVFEEVVKVAGATYNQTGKIFTEVVLVIGAMGNFVIGKLLIQTVKVGMTLTRVITRTFTEIIKIVGIIFQLGSNLIFYETIKVANALTRLTGRIFIENVVSGWNKIKLVLNGIQVGLWKKVARVTNGVWRKVSRNDN